MKSLNKYVIAIINKITYINFIIIAELIENITFHFLGIMETKININNNIKQKLVNISMGTS